MYLADLRDGCHAYHSSLYATLMNNDCLTRRVGKFLIPPTNIIEVYLYHPGFLPCYAMSP
jgi:hypothetical protein